MKEDPASVVIGSGGTVGSQGWMMPALIARAAGVDPKAMRYLGYETGGEGMAALLGGTIDALPSDSAEMLGQMEAGEVRVLATFSDQRLPGAYKDVPTVKEAGYDVEWPIVRGFYAAPGISDDQYAYWTGALTALNANPAWQKARADQGLFEYNLVGADFDAFVKERTQEYRALAASVGLPTSGN